MRNMKNNPEAEALILLVAGLTLFCHVANNRNSAELECQSVCLVSWITFSLEHHWCVYGLIWGVFAYLVC